MLTSGMETFANQTLIMIQHDEDTVEVMRLTNPTEPLVIYPSLCTPQDWWNVIAYCAGMINPEDIETGWIDELDS